jgi:transposase-like protein
MDKKVIKKYTPAVKTNLIQQHLEGKRTLLELSKASGAHISTLRDWVKAYQKTQKPAPQKASESNKPVLAAPAAPKQDKKVPTEEETRLRKELATVREEREILKQALRILSS